MARLYSLVVAAVLLVLSTAPGWAEAASHGLNGGGG
jgi:hypothetical protein